MLYFSCGWNYDDNKRGEKMEKITCKKCGWKWLPRVEKPISCPNCKQYIKEEEVEK